MSCPNCSCSDCYYRYNPISDEERKHRDLNQVRFGVVIDPDELHPAARREWDLQRFESRWRF